MTVWQIIEKFREAWASGLLVTLKLSALVWVAGITGGIALGAIAAKWRGVVGYPFQAIRFLLTGIPVLIFLFWLHFPLQALMKVVIDPFYTAALALSIINVFAVAELVRGTLADFPKQYVVAAQVSGLSPGATFRRIQFPIIFRQILPGLLTLQVGMVQMTLFASLISVDEIFRTAQRINAQIYRPVEIYTALAVFFALVCLPVYGLAAWLRVRYTRDLSER